MRRWRKQKWRNLWFDMDILNIILQNTYSLSQLKHRLGLLKAYLEQQIFGGQTSPAALDPWINTLDKNLLSGFNKDNLSLTFENLQTQISNLETLTLYLNFEPDESTLTQLGEMVRKTFGRTIMMDIKYDPNLIAGAALVWRGLYKDYSLRSKIEAKKGEILNSFQAFLR